jgi:NAD(P)-dependent dehydrogenase (short-subunit alcohol dehydrogenase family)
MNRVALVTGANRGIGRGIAEGLARSGITVFVGARSHADAREAAAGIGHG